MITNINSHHHYTEEKIPKKEKSKSNHYIK